MVLAIKSDPAPLRIHPSGTIYVGDTRVMLELVIAAHLGGASPEEIVERFDTLDLGDVYWVISYYLHHKDEVHLYLEEQERQAAEIRAMIEARQGSQEGLRERLLARLSNKESHELLCMGLSPSHE